MDSFSFDMPDRVETGSFLSLPGIYHVAITEVANTTKKGELFDGLRITAVVLDGTVRDAKDACTEVEKQTDIMVWKPKMNDDAEQQKRAANSIARLLLATAIANESDLGRAGFQFKPEDMVGRQMIVKLVFDKDEKYLRCWGDFWHVDDAQAAKYPKNKAALDLIPRGLRRESSPEPKAAGKKKAAKPAAANGHSAPPPSAPPAEVNCDDI